MGARCRFAVSVGHIVQLRKRRNTGTGRFCQRCVGQGFVIVGLWRIMSAWILKERTMGVPCKQVNLKVGDKVTTAFHWNEAHLVRTVTEIDQARVDMCRVSVDGG